MKATKDIVGLDELEQEAATLRFLHNKISEQLHRLQVEEIVLKKQLEVARIEPGLQDNTNITNNDHNNNNLYINNNPNNLYLLTNDNNNQLTFAPPSMTPTQTSLSDESNEISSPVMEEIPLVNRHLNTQ